MNGSRGGKDSVSIDNEGVLPRSRMTSGEGNPRRQDAAASSGKAKKPSLNGEKWVNKGSCDKQS